AVTGGGSVRVIRSLVTDNAAGQGGGGISAAGGSGTMSAVTVVDSTIANNQADAVSGSSVGGGGIHLFHASVLSLIRSTMNGNRGNVGGAIASESRVKVLNSTIADNSTT